MMYSVIIADDEPFVLYKEKNIFNWKEYGFELIGEASSSEELLEMINEKKPDAVFTDINMPGVSGLDLIKHVRSQKNQTTFVIISGYADFKYAQAAIKYGVFGYLLKPVTSDDANSLLENLKDYLDEKNGVFKNLDIDNAKNESFRRLIDYINEHYLDKLYLTDLAQKFDINMTYCCYLFKKNFDCSFSRYILTLRMKKAAELILESNMTITDISEYLGYDYYHFNKTFKNFYSLTPKQYKTLHK